MVGAVARREKNRAEMRASILEAARVVITGQGADALTIRGIAKMLGYSPGAIYEYFDSKETILKSLFFEGSGGLEETIRNELAALPQDTNPIDKLLVVARCYRALAMNGPEMYRLVMGALKCPPPEFVLELTGGMPGALDHLFRLMNEAIEEGLLEPVDVPSWVSALWSLAHGYLSLELSGHFDVIDLVVFGKETDEVQVRARRDKAYEQAFRDHLYKAATGKGRAILDS